MFLHELALKLGKTVREVLTGEPGMSAHELTVEWPCYFEAKHRLEKLQVDLEGSVSPEQFDAQFEE